MGLSEAVNPELANMPIDVLYHFNIVVDKEDQIQGEDRDENVYSLERLREMFGDVRYVCMGGSADRAEVFANEVAEQLGVEVPEGGPQPIGKTERYSLYKVGPVISVNHGMGKPSVSILMHEIFKLLHYAGVEDPAFMRIGTSGGLGVEPGTVVLTRDALNQDLEASYEQKILGGSRRHWPAGLDESLREEIFAARGDIAVAIGDTVGTDDFYEEQARFDGFHIPTYTREQADEFFVRAHEEGALNFEMESDRFAADCARAKVRAAILCCTLVDRLKGDQITASKEELAQYSANAQQLALNFIKADLAKLEAND